MSNFLRTVPLFLTALILFCAHSVRANELERLFLDSVVFTNVGYASGSTVISNFPLRVDVSTTCPNGFDYELANNWAGDVRFNYYEEYVQDSTNAVIDTTCYYSVSNWNPGGVSTIYVKLPRFSDNPKAKLTMYWNPVEYAELPPNLSLMVPAAITDSSKSFEWNKAITDQESNPYYIGHGPAYRRVKNASLDWVSKLLDYWLVEPTISSTKWKQGEPVATVTTGKAGSLTSNITISYIDRNTGTELGTAQPLTPGSYCAIVSTVESETYASIEKRLSFDIASGVSAGGSVGPNDFAYSVTFPMTGMQLDFTKAAKLNEAGEMSRVMATTDFKSEIKSTGAVTIGCWFKADKSVINNRPHTDQADKIALVSLASGPSARGPLSIILRNNGKPSNPGTLKIMVLGVGLQAGSATQKITRTLVEPSPARGDWGDGEWHFAMATRNENTGVTCLYLDGELIGSSTNLGWPMYDDGAINNFSIGCDPKGVGNTDEAGMAFIGNIAEAQVYNRDLTAAEISAMYNKGEDLKPHPQRLTGRESGLIAYYPMDSISNDGWFKDMNKNAGTHDIQAGGTVRMETLTDLPFVNQASDMSKYPVYIKFSEINPVGFSYDTLVPAKPTTSLTDYDFYREVRFFDESGSMLNYEIEAFLPGGESSVWVDTYHITANSKIVMCWGQFAYTLLPENDTSAVWSDSIVGKKDYVRDLYVNNYSTLIKSPVLGGNPGQRFENRWIVEPTLEFYYWLPGGRQPTVNFGSSYNGVPTVKYYNRTTGELLAEMPKDEPGEYRAVFRVEESRRWGSLELTRDFRIIKEQGNHNPGDMYRRVLIANADFSVDRGEVDCQSYDDNEPGWGTPYWKHHEADSTDDVSDFDSTKLFASYNLFAGTHHEYVDANGVRIWGLVNVRFGNLFNNGKYHPGERVNEGLNADQNYLPWNPDSQRMLSYQGLTVGEFHRYAGTFVMQNVFNDAKKQYSQICSPLYDDGIGTIYFDVVNAFTDNVYDEYGRPNYAIVVEVATNMLKVAEGGVLEPYYDAPPSDGNYPEGIWSISADPELCDYYRYADWQPVTMHPFRFHADTGVPMSDCTELPTTKRLVLDVTDGGTSINFFRVYVPLSYNCPARFRIRRVALDKESSLSPDADAYILVDNVICSTPIDHYNFKPYGRYDKNRSGKQLLGQELAFNPSFPGVGDGVFPRVRAVDKNGNDVPSSYVSAATMHYRWTYLNQARTDWMIADLDPDTLSSAKPLMLPEGLPGDIEFWFEGSFNADYYNYANYSGTKTAIPGYTEACSLATNGLNGAKADWSVRIREGRSECEEAVLVVKNNRRNTVEELQMMLIGDHTWRGYFQTTNPIPQGIGVRVEFRNTEPNGNKEWLWNTNCYYLATDVPSPFNPYSGRMNACSKNDWTQVPVDAYTGYLMFQVDESTKAMSVVRADYQNFNKWTDGLSTVTNVVFIGTAGDDSALPASGVSPNGGEYFVDYTTNLEETVYTRADGIWGVDFHEATVDPYKTFPAGEVTSSDWRLGKGRFVYGLFSEPQSGYAFQMAGCGEGYAEFSDMDNLTIWPRGIQKVSFSARLAQSIGFDDFSYYDGSVTRQNYVIAANGAFDHESNESFTGNASLSLVGYYRRGKGCYEMRWEQVGGEIDSAGVVQGAYKRGQRLSLYRWTKNNAGGYDSTLLYCATNDWFRWSNSNQTWVKENGAWRFDMPKFESTQTVEQGNFLPMRFAVYEKTIENSGKTYTGTMLVVAVYSKGSASMGDQGWMYMSYFDCSDSRLKQGTYGLLTANSGGFFKDIATANVPDAAKETSTASTKFWGLADGGYHYLPSQPNSGQLGNSKGQSFTKELIYPIPATSFTSCDNDIKTDMWVEIPGRNEHFKYGSKYGFQACPVNQTVSVLASKGTGDAKYDTVLATYSISNNWGQLKSSDRIGSNDFYWRPEDARLRFKAGGDLDGIRTDVVIDDINVWQWRGYNEVVMFRKGTDANWDRTDVSKDKGLNIAPGNFIFMNGWVNKPVSGETAIELSAKRSIATRPTGIRTPLMDGLDGRGSGLGNIEFHYRNCQPNTRLLVQIATNVSVGEIGKLSKSVETSSSAGSWMTIAVLTYDELKDYKSMNFPVGIRIPKKGYGIVGRIIIDPELVTELANEDDTASFGSIEITKVLCQDEPPIDKGCWWGWNLRTLGDAYDTERRMYLPDASEKPGEGFSLALNNSVTEDIDQEKAANYPKHMPFLQSPTFTNNVIGEVSFRARKYSTSDYDQYAEIAIYGMKLENIVEGLDDNWELLARFVVSNTVFTTYSFRASEEGKYCAIRLGVTGVKGVNPSSRGPAPKAGNEPVRVLLDEVTISEAINPQLSIRNIGAFRTDLEGRKEVPNVPSKEEQPLCEEAWGIQCELYSVMLDDEIDKRHPPAVKLYWYEGKDNWGIIKKCIENGTTDSRIHSGYLARAEGTEALVYRSSYDLAPDAVIPSSHKDADPIVVQYMLEIRYSVINPTTGVSESRVKLVDVMNEWVVPSWYAPVNYNTNKAYNRDGNSLSCFCILDELAPGWAWINEVNIYNHSSSGNVDDNCQFVEIAAPKDIDMLGWRIEMLESFEESDMIITNTVATFGMNGLATKKTTNAISNYVFHVVGCPDQRNGHDRTIFDRAGALDGVWKFTNTRNSSAFDVEGTITRKTPVGIRLVRPNGVVEHEIVTVGTNIYTSARLAIYSPTGVVEYLNRATSPGTFFYPEQDSIWGDHSVGVVNSRGEMMTGNWNNTMKRTPGEINEGQQINPDYPLPMGDMVYVFADLDQSGGNIWQSFDGGITFTNESIRTFVRKGSTVGTNVLYKVEPWYEVAYAKQVDGTNETYLDVSNGFNKATRTVEVFLAQGCSNKVTVTVKAGPDHQLVELGCDENNIYTPAVINWLQGGSTLRGGFANNDNVIRLCEFWGLHSGATVPPTYLTLTEMYWLDIDPTAGDMVLQAGMCDPPSEVLYSNYQGSASVTNLQMSVFMMITNKVTNDAWSPYVLRGVQPGETSLDYVPGNGSAWTSETFKISGILPNGHTSELNPDNWVDLRYFVFRPDSFYQPEDEPAHRRFTTDIEVFDPVNSKMSPGYGAGWYDWVRKNNSNIRPFFRWALDTRLRPFGVELLYTNNYYTVTSP